MPTLKRNIATTAATASTSAHASHARQHRHIEGDGSEAQRPHGGEERVQGEPDREVEDDADHRRRDRRQRRAQGAVAAQPLDEGRAEEDPQEARHEGDPGGEQPAEGAGQERAAASRDRGRRP